MRRIILILWTLAFLSPAACNAYLMASRPIVYVGHRPETVPKDWMCGRITGGPYCVKISQQDGAVQSLTFAVFLLIGLPGLLLQMPKTLREQQKFADRLRNRFP